MSQCVKVPEIRHCVDCIQDVVSFFSYSAKRTLCLEKVIKYRAPESMRTRLVGLCSTRFVERHTAVLVFSELLPFTVEALQGMSNWESTDTRKKASQLLNSILTTQFVICLVVLESITALMHPISESLQKVGNDIIKSLNEIDELVELLSNWRLTAESKFSELFIKAETYGDMLGVTLTAPRIPHRSVFRSNSGGAQNANDYYRVNVFIPLLDAICVDIKNRFGPHQQQSYSLASLIPSQLQEWEQVKPAVDKYSNFLQSSVIVQGEFQRWNHKWWKLSEAERRQYNTAISALNACPADFFPNINVLLRILATLPSSTAEPERVFSKVTKTLSALRSSMGEDRLEACVLLQVHRELLPDIDSIIDDFARSASRRLHFLV